MSFYAYTDGSSKGNPGKGGWGAHISKNGKIFEIHGRKEMTTNNEMELTASIKALEFFPEAVTIEIFTDSNYVLKGITQWIKAWKKNNWKTYNGGELKNKSLWLQLDKLNNFHNVKWTKVKAHSGIFGNERADYLATF